MDLGQALHAAAANHEAREGGPTVECLSRPMSTGRTSRMGDVRRTEEEEEE